MRVFNTTRLIDQVTLKAALATGDFSDQEILDLAYDCLLLDLVPLIVTLREDYFVRKESQAIVANQSHYPMPTRAAGETLRDIKYIKGNQVQTLYRISREEVTTTTTGEPQSFYIEENKVVLYPTPDQAYGTLQLSYFLRCPALVPVSECGEISTINTNTNTVTGTFPASWSTSSDFDLVCGSPGYENLAMDQTANTVSTSSITFASTLPTDLAVGDYVTLAEESCFVQLPPEAHLLLVNMTVAACLEAKGDREGLAVAQARVDKSTAALRAFFQERVEGQPQRFTTSLL